jgi:ADP-ribose pyrophosphatase YjhB (NUDIX family)
MIKKLPKKEFKRIYSKVPRLCVDLVIRNKSEKVLLTKRAIYPENIWHIPGGTLLFDETIEEAINRIAKEELGVKVKMKKLLGYVDNGWVYSKNYGRPVTLEFSVDLIDSESKIRVDHQASEYNFFDKLPKNMDPGQKKFLSTLKE